MPSKVKSISVKHVQQHIREDLLTDLDQVPSRIRRWFIDNVFRRSLSYLVAFTEDTKAKVLRCTADGKLKVAPSGSGLTIMAVYSGLTVNAYAPGQTHEFTKNYSYMDILIETNDITMSIKQENGAWGNDFSVPIGTHDYHFVASGVKFKSRVAGAHGNYEIIVMR